MRGRGVGLSGEERPRIHIYCCVGQPVGWIGSRSTPLPLFAHRKTGGRVNTLQLTAVPNDTAWVGQLHPRLPGIERLVCKNICSFRQSPLFRVTQRRLKTASRTVVPFLNAWRTAFNSTKHAAYADGAESRQKHSAAPPLVDALVARARRPAAK